MFGEGTFLKYWFGGYNLGQVRHRLWLMNRFVLIPIYQFTFTQLGGAEKNKRGGEKKGLLSQKKIKKNFVEGGNCHSLCHHAYCESMKSEYLCQSIVFF